MEKVDAFKASDGSLWATEDGCKEHEVALRWHGRINEYRESDLCPYPRGAHGGMCTRIIISWELFKTRQLDVVK